MYMFEFVHIIQEYCSNLSNLEILFLYDFSMLNLDMAPQEHMHTFVRVMYIFTELG